jgi:uncharacterized phage protein (TIGR01671 family)
MRTIRFRAWDNTHKLMIGENVIVFTPSYKVSDLKGVSLAGIANGKNLTIEPLHNCEVMQFTGLLDKNGKEIYEGDVVRILYTDWASKPEDDPRTLEQYLIEDKCHVGEVVYKPVEFLIDFHTVGKWGGDSCGYLKSGDHGWIEVIGNVWENPEFLGKESV